MTVTRKNLANKADIYLKHYVDQLRRDPVVAARELLGVELAPHQRYVLRNSWETPWSMHVWGRGSGKSAWDAFLAALSAVLYPGVRVVIVGPGFRQAQFVFKEIEKIYNNWPVFKDCIMHGGGSRGIKHNTSEWSMEFKNGSWIFAVPLGSDGSKIRGYRAHVLIIDEAVQVPPEIIDTVLIPFMATNQNPLAQYLGMEENTSTNKLVYTTSAYFSFNHMYRRYSSFLEEIYANGSKDYFVSRFNYRDMPAGFIDQKVVELARNQSTVADFRMEWEAEWVTDTAGFYPASLIETVKSLEVSPEIKGSSGERYVLGVDPATTYNTCGFCVLKVGSPMEIVNVATMSDTSYPKICSRILEYMSNFNIVRIGLDAGAGKPVVDMFKEGRPLVDSSGVLLNKRLLAMDDLSGDGQRIINVIPATTQSVTEINFNMKAAMESGKVRWPAVSGADEDGEKEDIVEEIRQMEAEYRMVEANQNRTGWYSFSVPPHKNKDRYSASLFAVAASREFIQDTTKILHLPSGRWSSR